MPEITQFSESERLIVLESEDIKQYRTSLKKNGCEFLKLPKLSQLEDYKHCIRALFLVYLTTLSSSYYTSSIDRLINE
jgi:hypothetical protein